MEAWELEFKWLQLKHRLTKLMSGSKMPELKSILFLIGVQEYGTVRKDFSKEEKRDMMHIAACSLLETRGYYNFAGRDDEGWPHWDVAMPFDIKGLGEQEHILKECIIEYFGKLDNMTELEEE